MPGATSSDLYLLDYPDRREVLRVFRAERWDTTVEDLSTREIRILEALRGSPVPAPAPIGTFTDNGVIMSWLPGAVDLPTQPDTHWLAALASMLVRIHQSQVEVPWLYHSWNDSRGDDPPDWWQDHGLWIGAQSLSAQPPAFESTFIHRDYHPVNVLWQEDRVSGVVDWINACMGPAGIDVAHCRLNLAIMYGQEIADAFLASYETAAPDYRHDFYWDLDDALGALPDVEPYAPWAEFGLPGHTREIVRSRLEAFIGAALQRQQA